VSDKKNNLGERINNILDKLDPSKGSDNSKPNKVSSDGDRPIYSPKNISQHS